MSRMEMTHYWANQDEGGKPPAFCGTNLPDRLVNIDQVMQGVLPARPCVRCLELAEVMLSKAVVEARRRAGDGG